MNYSSFTYSNTIENKFIRFLKPEFVLNNSTPAEALLIRLLTGTLSITNRLTSDNFDQKNNYSILGYPENQNISTRHLKECIEPESSLIKLCEHIKRSRRNSVFFENILEEYCSYFYKTTRNSHTTGFLHLYRVLEYMSYSFPLIYASIDHDYYGSFNKLKNYFDTSKNELLFFNAFIEKLLDSSLLDTPLTFAFNTLFQDVNRNHYQLIKKYLPLDSISGDSPNISLTTNYRQLILLTIEIRNRYFHFATGGKRNIKGTEIIENDIFFSIINEELANWVAIIYFDILKHMCER